MATAQARSGITVRPLAEKDLAEADRIVRVAFGTFLGMPDPATFMGDAGCAHTRWKADPSSALAAEHNGRVIGSNFIANWGSFGFFGPLSVEPAYWNSGVAQLLLGPTMEIFRQRGHRHLGLYTFAHSAKHMALYQKFGFWPRDLVAIMGKEAAVAHRPVPPGSARFSESKTSDRAGLLAECRELAGKNFVGLDLGIEIRSVADQNLGDTILIWDSSKLAGFAVCHTGPGTEAGSGACYVKFATARSGPRAGEEFTRLLDAVETYAMSEGAKKITAGVNLARRDAFRALRSMGFRTEMQGVAMETGDASSGYNRSGVYIIDDWR